MDLDAPGEWHSLDGVRERLGMILLDAHSSIAWIAEDLSWLIANEWGQRLLLLAVDERTVTMVIPPCGGVDWEPAWMPEEFLEVVKGFLSAPVRFQINREANQVIAILQSRDQRQTLLHGEYWPNE